MDKKHKMSGNDVQGTIIIGVVSLGVTLLATAAAAKFVQRREGTKTIKTLAGLVDVLEDATHFLFGKSRNALYCILSKHMY